MTGQQQNHNRLAETVAQLEEQVNEGQALITEILTRHSSLLAQLGNTVEQTAELLGVMAANLNEHETRIDMHTETLGYMNNTIGDIMQRLEVTEPDEDELADIEAEVERTTPDFIIAVYGEDIREVFREVNDRLYEHLEGQSYFIQFTPLDEYWYSAEVFID
jgi:uncharacterized phage infection (PIP) family protein YhgE